MEKIQFKKKDRDRIAALLSVIPGAGHLYKHHYLAGIGIMTGGTMLMVLVTALLALATFGLAILLVPLAYMLGVAYAAYELEDWHGKHHALHPWRDVEAPKE